MHASAFRFLRAARLATRPDPILIALHTGRVAALQHDAYAVATVSEITDALWAAHTDDLFERTIFTA